MPREAHQATTCNAARPQGIGSQTNLAHPPDMSASNPANFGVGSWIERRARVSPDRPALIARGRQLTYAEMAGRIRRLANGLRKLGVAKGDRVAWLGVNDPAFLESLFAVGLLGAVIAPVNHRLSVEERALVLADTEPIVVIEHHAMEPTPVPRSVRHRVTVGDPGERALDYESVVAGSSDDPVPTAVGLDDLLLLPHTSGTTGRPKGVMLTHGNVTWNVVNFLTSADFRNDDVTIAIAPFFRVGGTGVNVLPVLFMGGTVVVPEAVRADGILSEIERHRVSVGFGNPDLLDEIVRSPGWPTADLSGVRFILTGGAPVPDRLVRAFLERGVPLLQGYGLSEAGPLALLLDPASATRKIGSAGRPPLLVDVRIVDADGQDVVPGEAGELLVRGPNVMAGYWRRPRATREVLRDGWLRTGDAARADDQGFVWIVDRVSARYAAVGGVVYPGDVERVLLEHVAVAEAGVVGVAAHDANTVGVAFVVLHQGARTSEEELLAFARLRLPARAVPASLRFLPELPRNSVGKLRRDQLRILVAREDAARPTP
jgi:fatty-acyl-CoA synthase